MEGRGLSTSRALRIVFSVQIDLAGFEMFH